MSGLVRSPGKLGWVIVGAGFLAAASIARFFEAWHRSWLVRQAPGYDEAVQKGKTAEELGEPVYTIDELRRLYTFARTSTDS